MQLVGQMRKSSSPFCCLSNYHIIRLTQVLSVRVGWLLCVISNLCFAFVCNVFLFGGRGSSFNLGDKGTPSLW